MVPELLLQTSSCVNSIYICTYKLEFNSITISWASHTDENTYVFEDYGHFNVFQWDLFHRNTDGLTCISKNKDLCFENVSKIMTCAENMTHKGTDADT